MDNICKHCAKDITLTRLNILGENVEFWMHTDNFIVCRTRPAMIAEPFEGQKNTCACCDLPIHEKVVTAFHQKALMWVHDGTGYHICTGIAGIGTAQPATNDGLPVTW